MREGREHTLSVAVEGTRRDACIERKYDKREGWRTGADCAGAVSGAGCAFWDGSAAPPPWIWW